MGAGKKIGIIVGCILLVLALAVLVTVLISFQKSNNDSSNNQTTTTTSTTTTSSASPGGAGRTAASVKNIKQLCEKTNYRDTCEEELTNFTGNRTDTKSLLKAAFNATAEHIRQALNHSDVMRAAAADPDTAKPYETCMEFFDYAIQDLSVAIDHIAGYKFEELDKAVGDLMNWLGAVRADQETCLDEFSNHTTDAAADMRNALNRSIELSSNAIMIAHYVGEWVKQFIDPSLTEGGGARRLLGAECKVRFPSWVSPDRRMLLQMPPFQMKPSVVVAKDGSGQFKTVNEAVASLPKNNSDFVVMYIKEGVYDEIVMVGREYNKLVIVGDGPTKTKITGNLHVGMPGRVAAADTATFVVAAAEFMAKDIGFENTAGPEANEAVAFRSQSETSVLYNCRFDGYKNTIFAHSYHQFYRDCTITGNVDFIFGAANAYFQNCNIVVRKSSVANQQNTICAHGSTEAYDNTYFVLHNCTISAEPELVPAESPTYLGRPWKASARTVFLQCQLDGIIHPDGWLASESHPEYGNTCLLGEFDNHGEGAGTSKRVKWRGVRELSPENGKALALEEFMGGAGFVKTSGAPFSAGLLPLQSGQPLPQQSAKIEPALLTRVQAEADDEADDSEAGIDVDVDVDIDGGKKKKKKKDKEKKGKKRR